MTEPAEPTEPKTKSERIKELLDAGLSSQEVVYLFFQPVTNLLE